MPTGSIPGPIIAPSPPNAELYPSSDRLDEWLLIGRLRKRIFSHASGNVLDVACGDGVNVRYIPSECYITAGDISAAQVSAARSRASRLGRSVDLRTMDAHALPFPDRSFDTVISSFALCSYADPDRALHELARVCKLDGTILLLEHGRSSCGPWGAWQDRTERRRGEHTGCHENREPLDLALAAGLEIVSARRTWFGTIHSIEARPGRGSFVEA